jgi:large subunit ribosomal protein L14e
MDETFRRKIKMIEVGRVCMKIAGRDSGNLAVVVEMIDSTYVLIDGNVRRKKCNLRHLEPTKTKLKIKAKASTADVKAAMKKAGLEVVEKKERTRQKKEVAPKAPKKTAAKKKVVKKAVKKEAKK